MRSGLDDNKYALIFAILKGVSGEIALRRFGLLPKQSDLKFDEIEYMKQLYFVEKITLRELSDRFNHSKSYIFRRLHDQVKIKGMENSEQMQFNRQVNTGLGA
jgi:hypothetical protein